MSVYRTYFDKDTVIVRNSCANTGRNPIAEVFHGGSLDTDKTTFKISKEAMCHDPATHVIHQAFIRRRMKH